MADMRMKRTGRTPKRHCGSRLLAAFLALCMTVTMFPVGSLHAAAAGERNSPIVTEGSKTVYQIRSFNDLKGAADYSRGDNWDQVQVYRLMNDISIREDEMSQLGDNHLTFGTSAKPFCAEFDGRGHTISGLSYAENIVSPQGRTGLFSYTGRDASKDVPAEDAYIHDLTLDGANIYADYDSGILIGDAYNTKVVNVIVKNSTVHVFPANNVLTLIADGGVFGGGMAGYSKDSIFYNCEARNVSVLNNKTGAVQALAGKGLYLGGLVGMCDNTTLEYCRADGGRVSNYYDVAVAALGGNTLYVGGLVGKMRHGSKAVDCFATNNLHYYCANYVSVGSGTAGHAGGIAGGVVSEDGGESCLIRRCHFAGEITSEQINSILILPVIIQYNVNRSGLVDSLDGGVRVENSFFNKTTTTAYTNNKEDPANTLGSETTGDFYGPKEDSVYMDRSFWEGMGYDFSGLINRGPGSTYPDEHYNKWVMRYVTDEETGVTTGMPVHGKSVAAAFDFPGAGSVTVRPVGDDHLSGDAAVTDDAAAFAVLPFYPGEGKAGEDDETADGKVKIAFAPNEGYRLEQWYVRPETTVTGVGGDLSVYARIYGDDANKVTVSDPQLVKDNELYLARVQANVVFCDVTGGTEISNEWYHYNDRLPEIVPGNAPGDEVKLVGWTTDKPYDSITSTELENLKRGGKFHVAGDPIQKAMKLYPVYANLLANAKVRIEGHNEGDVATRTGVGNVTVANIGGEDVLRFTPEGDALPDGCRFLGWYEKEEGPEGPEDAEAKWHRIGTDYLYSLENVDMTVEHWYEARFEYRVDYYAVTGHKPDADNTEPYPWNKPYAQLWQQYNTPFDSTVSMPADYHGVFDGWYEGKPAGVTDEGCSAGAVAAGKTITEPYIVHNHRKDTDGAYKVFVTTDFPGSAVVEQSGNGSLINDFAVSVTPNANYNFLFWASDEKTLSSSTEWEHGGTLSTLKDYGFEAHMTANAVFHDKNGDVLSTVQRRYEENLFLAADVTDHTYTYPLTEEQIDDTALAGAGITVPGSGASPDETSMEENGYYFVGWVDKDALSEDEFNYLYDVKGDPNTCSSVEKALPYVLDEHTAVTRAMPSLYPVYVKYEIETGTNVVFHGSINCPNEPTYETPLGENLTGESSQIEVTAYNNVPISSDPAETEKFVLSKLTVQVDGGAETELEKPLDTTGDWRVTYTVKPGCKYFFKAWYQPYTLLFHIKSGETKVFVCNADTKIGSQEGAPPAAAAHEGTSDLDGTLFVGWTAESAALYHKKETVEEARELPYYSNSTLQTAVVTRSCEFWPVYVAYNVSIGTGDGGTGGLQRSDDATTLKAVATPEAGHTFIEWRDEDGKPVSKEKEFTVPDPFGGHTYTPVFETLYHVKYFAPDGTTVLHEDELGGLTDQDVVLVTEKGEVLSAKPYTLVAKEMQGNQHFAQWVWKTGLPGEVKYFEEFCHDPIVAQIDMAHSTVMELYPVVWSMTVTAYDDSGAASDITDSTTISVGKSTGSSGQLSIRCSVPEDCTAHKLVLHAGRKTWRAGEDDLAIAGTPVIITSGSKRLVGRTDESGNAEFILNKKKVTIENGDPAAGGDKSIKGKNETYDGTPKKGYEGTPTVEGYTGEFKEIYYEKTGTDEKGDPIWQEISSEPIRAGDYKVKISIPASDPELEGSTEVTFKITKANVDISGLTAENSTYDGAAKTGYTGTPQAAGYTGTFAVTYYEEDGVTPLPGKPTDAGKYKVKIAIPAGERNYTGSTTLDFEIEKAAYTGRTEAFRYLNETVSSTVDVTLPILPDDAAAYGTAAHGTGSNGKITMGAVGADRKITVKNESLTVADGPVTFTVPVTGAKNYNDYNVTVTITPTSKTEAVVTADPKNEVYDGQPKLGYENAAATAAGYNYTGSYVLLYRKGNAPIDPGHPETPPTDVGSYTVKLSLPETETYFGSVVVPFTVSPKPLGDGGTDSGITGVEPENAEYDGSPHSGYTGTPAATDAAYTGGFDVSYVNRETGEELAGEPVNVGRYKAVFTPKNPNYSGRKELEFEITKKQVNITATPKDAEYDGARKLGYDGKPDTGEYVGMLSFTYYDSANTVLGDQPINVGSYKVKIAIPDGVKNYKGETTVSFKITRKRVEVTGVTKKDDEADGRPKPGYTGEPHVPGYEGEFDIIYKDGGGNTLPAPPSEPGSYKVIIKPKDPNYTGEKVIDFTITPSGGQPILPGGPGGVVGPGGSGGYPVNIPDTDGAEVKADHDTAEPGEKVVVTVTPEEGKKVDKVTVTDDAGREIPVTDNGDGTWSFSMPDSGVTVEVTLVCPKDKTCPISKYKDSSPTAWYHDGVHYCLEEGLMVGYNAVKFGPNDRVTRSQLVQILYNEAGNPAVATPGRFEDVPHNAWYEKAIVWGDDTKVIYGYSDTEFGPEDPITREQLAAILYRHAGSPAASGDISGFKDYKKTAPYAVSALQWAVENKIIYGRDGNLLAPAGTASRAEAACMIQRYLENYVGKKTENSQEK